MLNVMSKEPAPSYSGEGLRRGRAQDPSVACEGVFRS